MKRISKLTFVSNPTYTACATLALLTVGLSAQEARFFRILSSEPTSITACSPEGYVTWSASPGLVCTVQTTVALAPHTWSDYARVISTEYTVTRRLFNPNPPAGMALIPAGWFRMGDFSGELTSALPLHDVYVSGFYMDRYEVTKTLWDEVYRWATNNGYSFEGTVRGKAASHPAYTVHWYNAVKWCNARSEKEDRTPAYYTNAEQTAVYRSGTSDLRNEWVNWNAGYRLPTEAEWEKAARGGAVGRLFPWADSETITHAQANYYSTNTLDYDVSPTRGFHPAFFGTSPYTSPVGYFPPNAYGLYDMAGNINEWCWDWRESGYYASGPNTDPHGPTTPPPTFPSRVMRGGAYLSRANFAQAGFRDLGDPGEAYVWHGFRTVLPGE